MAAARCSHCDITFPYDHKVCDACGEDTWQLNHEKDTWDSDWREQVSRIKKRHRAGTPIHDLRHTKAIVKEEGRLYVADTLLQDVGYHDLESGSVVQINGEFYEVLHAVLGKTAAWRIELIPLEGVWPDDIPILNDFDYQNLEKARIRQ